MTSLLQEPYEIDNIKKHSDSSLALSATAATYKWEIVWINVFAITILHIAGVYGFYLFCSKAMWTTVFLCLITGHISGLGITAGAHRLWTHRSYKAKLPLRIFLLYLNTMAMQGFVIHWARDHRLHHKYSDTDADPHNSNRGFFFSHIGWVMLKKHPEVKIKGKTIDISDLTADPLLRFQKRYFPILTLVICYIIPAYIPTLWGESLYNAFFINLYRYIHSLNATCLVNSAAHLWGYHKPYDGSISPVEIKMVSALTTGEGFHNYHHTFPWDYKAAELGNYKFNVTTMFIDLMAKIGWAYDLKTVPSDVIHRRAQRTGDGSYNSQ